MRWARAVVVGCLATVAACSSGAAPNTGIGGSSGGSGGGVSSGGSGSGGTSTSSSGSGGVSSSSSGVSSGGSGSGSGGPGSSSGGGSGSGSGSSGGSSGAPVGDGGSGGPLGGEAGTPPAEVMGCSSAKLYAVPDDPSVMGPWAVGVKTAHVTMTGGSRPVEVWYPAAWGSETGVHQVTYDLTSWLPAGQAMKIPAAENKPQACNCYRDLPLDTTHGPYPVVIFLHGTGSFRTAELSTMTTWASRGFIAVAADHAGLYLGDFLAFAGTGCTAPTGTSYLLGMNLSADVDAMIAAMTNKTGDFAFFGSSADMSRIGIGGHSQGASDAASYANKPNVQVDMPLADLGGTAPSATGLKSALVVGGMSDGVVAYSSDTSAYNGSSAPIKRLVGITGGDHLDVTDLCQTNDNGKTAIQVAMAAMVCGNGAMSLANLAKCGSGLSPSSIGPQITTYVTTAVLEETLHCMDRSAAFSGLKAKYSQVGDFQHSP